MRVTLFILAMLAAASSAPAQTSCMEPAQPPSIDGAQATADQLRAAMAQAHDFMAQSELYQSCLAQAGDPDAKPRIAASQRAQDAVGKAINAALDAYKRAQPN